MTVFVPTESRAQSQAIVSGLKIASEIIWNGQVNAVSRVYDERNESLANRICIRVRHPQNSGLSGFVLRLTGRIEFGSRKPPYSQAQIALRYKIYGDHRIGIPKDNDIKRMLLGHNNHVVQYKQSTSKTEPRMRFGRIYIRVSLTVEVVRSRCQTVD